ncbi:glycosyltransferase family 2 protein [Thermodesulfobacteriota bacterium]
MNPKVSVCITTYNHEQFIAQALDSVLMQKTDFDFEILIGEDDSEDRTREIVKEYKRQHPDKIQLFLNDSDNIIYINGRRTGRWNFINNLKNAKGVYIALLDGDDCWTDPNKLQAQVDLLEDNPELAICIHNVKVSYMNGSNKSHPYYTPDASGANMRQKPASISSIEDLIAGNFIQTPSVVYRAHLFDNFPEWFYKVDRADWPLHILNARHGKIGYIDKMMANYHVHDGGIYSGKTLAYQLEGAANIAAALDKHLSYKYHNIIFKHNTQRFVLIIKLHFTNANYMKSCQCLLKYIAAYRFEGLSTIFGYILNRVLLLKKAEN